MKKRVKFVGYNEFDYPIYEDENNKKYIDVNCGTIPSPDLHYSSSGGEPNCPVDFEYILLKKDNLFYLNLEYKKELRKESVVLKNIENSLSHITCLGSDHDKLFEESKGKKILVNSAKWIMRINGLCDEDAYTVKMFKKLGIEVCFVKKKYVPFFKMNGKFYVFTLDKSKERWFTSLDCETTLVRDMSAISKINRVICFDYYKDAYDFNVFYIYHKEIRQNVILKSLIHFIDDYGCMEVYFDCSKGSLS